MSEYTIGAIIRALLAAGLGWKAIAVLLALGVFALLVYKGLRFLATILERLVATRDALLSQTLERMMAQDARSAEFQRDTAAIMATMRADIASQLAEARDTRKEMHQRFNKVQEDITTIKGATS